MDSTFMILGIILVVLICVIAYLDHKKRNYEDSGVRGSKFPQPPKQSK